MLKETPQMEAHENHEMMPQYTLNIELRFLDGDDAHQVHSQLYPVIIDVLSGLVGDDMMHHSPVIGCRVELDTVWPGKTYVPLADEIADKVAARLTSGSESRQAD